jgi:hypothetical protein
VPLITLPLAGCDSGVSHGDVREIVCVAEPGTSRLVAWIAGTSFALAAGVALVKYAWAQRGRSQPDRPAARLTR